MLKDLRLEVDAGSVGTLALEVEDLGQAAGRPRRRLRLRAGSDGFTGSFSLVLDLPPAAEAPWFLFPGFFYGQGRTDKRLAYPALGRPDASGWTHPSWDFALDRGAYPVLLAHQDGQWRGLDFSPHYRLHDGAQEGPETWGEGEPQVGVGLSWHDGHGCLRLNLPANERPRRHARNRHDGPTAKQVWLGAGECLSLEVGVWEVAGDRHAYWPILRRVSDELSAAHPPAEALPHALLTETAVHGLLAWHWVDDPGYLVYTAAFDRSAEFNANLKKTTLGWHFEASGFVGGFPVAYALLWASARNGDGAARAVAERLIDRWCAEGRTAWGFFRTSYHPGRARTPNGAFANPAGTGCANPDPSGDTPFYGSCWQGDQKLIHVRTTADASLHLARCLDLLGDEHPRRAEWLPALRGTLEAALSVQDAQGRFGQLYDVVARRVHQAEGAGGLLWIRAFDAAEPLFDGDPAFQARLRSAMQRAGEGYAADIEAEWICGAPEDVSLAPTSEDGYNAILAYAALHRRWPTPRHLALWRRASDWTLTWRKAYNVRLPPRSVLACGGLRTVGGDFASANNNHLHVYGMICLAELFELARLTGDAHYARRADEHLRFTAQLLCVDDGQWNGQRGMLSEQFYTTDWSIWGGWDPTPAHVQKGTLMGFSHAWCIAMVLLGLEGLERAGRLDP